ncbi:hypothetical protein L218DRAFT_968073 [Marasmius fiardii PR-910]|nr:hypothetical protein L218DRAFT_968073 [Marasmius fiardii PR-910]
MDIDSLDSSTTLMNGETLAAPATSSTGPTRKFRTAAQRKAELEADPWLDSTRVTPKKVRCLGCGNDVKLDMREGSEYYPARWNKHKQTCRYVLEGKKKADEPEGSGGGGQQMTGPSSGTTTPGGAHIPVISKPPINVLPVSWTASSLKGGGSTMKSTADLLRELGRDGQMIWGSRPSTPTT